MNNLNSVLIEGNLTHDPNLTTLPSGKNVCRFSIATNYYYRNKEKELISDVTYVNIDTWGGLAESCDKYLKKGRGVRVVGRLRQERWNDEEGRSREKYIIVAEHVEFQGKPSREKEEEGAEGEAEAEEE